MVETNLIYQLAVILGIATLFAIIGRAIKQPTIIAYLIAGVISGPLFLGIINTSEFIGFFSHLGVTILLFVVGLSLDFRVLKHIGWQAAVIGIAQALVTSMLGFLLAIKIGFSTVSSFYLAAALAFSSTIVVVNLLSQKKELETLHGKLSIGILIVQDFLAAMIFMILPSISFFSGNPLSAAFSELAKGIALIAGVFLLSIFVVPRILYSVAKNQEILFLFSVVWGLLVTFTFTSFGFFAEIGALIAGMSLASSKFSLEISSKIRGIRDFFIIIHLVFFGSLLIAPITGKMLLSAVAFSALVFVGNPIIIMVFMKFFGYRHRTGFLAGISIAQISELSLILVFLGMTLNVVPREILSLTILIAIFTITASSYSIFYSSKLYNFLAPMLKIFEGRGKELIPSLPVAHDYVLLGYNRIGFNLLKAFKKSKKSYLVIDYNPKIIDELKRKGIKCLYGDAKDIELLDELKLEHSKVIISTIPDIETNLVILKNVKGLDSIFIATSHEIEHTTLLYNSGADYVIMPHFLGGNYVSGLILNKSFSKKFLKEESERQLKELKERIKYRQDHPRKDYHGE